ncbi:MAG: addiction module protein [Actinobacteria bacterium]|nr:addiction module protein [Actinomycetota bacterium]
MSAMPQDEIARLPVEQRLRLVEDIWESIRANPDELPMTEAQRAELDRRLAAHAADPEAAEDLDSVLARIRNRK